MSRKSKFLSLVLAFMLLCGCVPAMAEEATAVYGANVPEGYELVAENSRFNLYLEAKSMALIIESKATGEILRSTAEKPSGADNYKDQMASGITMEYIVDVEAKPTQGMFLKDTQVEVEKLDNGFVAHVTYLTPGISFDVRLEMDEAGFTVTVPEDSIVEAKEQTYVIIRNEDGVEERIDIAKLTKVTEVKEYIVTLADEQSYILVSSPVVNNGEFLNVTATDGSKCTIPYTEDTVKEYVADAKGNKTYLIPPTTLTVNEKGEKRLLVTEDADGQSVVNLRDETKAVTVKLADLTGIREKPCELKIKNNDGKEFAIDASEVKAVQTNLYWEATAVDGSQLRFPQEMLVEKSDISYLLGTLRLFPYMACSSPKDSEGYMIVPDGQGIIVSFEENNKRFKKGFSKPVYGLNIGTDNETATINTLTPAPAEEVIMPVYGMVHTDKQMAVLSVLQDGDMGAIIEAYPNGVNRVAYNWASAKITWRFKYDQPMGPGQTAAIAARTDKRRGFDVVQRFLLTEGEEASYAGLAVAYRNYLKDLGVFDAADDRGFDVKIDLLGMERENYILGKQDVVMTTYEQAGDIIEKLKNGGVENMSVLYRGWQTDGLSGGLPTNSYDPANSLGGKEGFAALRERAEKLGVKVGLEADVLSLITETRPMLLFSAFKQIYATTWSRQTNAKVYPTLNYLNPEASRDAANSLISGMLDAGVDDIAFTGITQLMADYYHRDAYHDVTELAGIYSDIIRGATEKGMSNILVSPNAYLWKLANAVTDMPIGGSDYAYADAEIPFLAIAMSGQIPYYTEYVNFQANTNRFKLRLIEQGARPAFLLTWEDPVELQNTNSSDIYSSSFELYESMIVSWYDELSKLHEAVGSDGEIVNHEREGNMTCVTWSNGTKVYLNFGRTEGTMDGVTLKSMEYVIKGVNGSDS